MEDDKNKLKFKAGKQYIKDNNIDEYVVLNQGDFWKHILLNLNENIVNFPIDFMKEVFLTMKKDDFK